MMQPLDLLNWLGTRKTVKLPGRLLLPAVLSLGFPRLLRLAGRRTVSASAMAPALLLTAGDIGKALHDQGLMARALDFTVQAMHLDTYCTVADLSLEAEACGCQVQFHQRDIPSVVTHPVHSTEDILNLAVPDPSRDGRMPVILASLSYLQRKYAVIKVANITGPFTLALQLCGSAIYADTLKDPEKVDRVLAYTGLVITRYARALFAHGADMLLVAEPAVSQLSKRIFERFAYPVNEKMVQELNQPCMLHICSKAEHLVDGMVTSHYTAFSVDEVDMGKLVQRLPPHAIAVGNISPLLLRYGTTAEIEAKTRTLLESTAGKREMIIAPGCDLAPDTPLANILAFVNTVKTWRRTSNKQNSKS
jgi:MtaA/CmuA family methyltransferase